MLNNAAPNIAVTGVSTPFELNTPNLTVWYRGSGNYRAYTDKRGIARSLQLLLKNYPADTKFVEGDVPQFYFGGHQLADVLKAAFGEKNGRALMAADVK